jgi:hypothetical protein
VREGVTSALSKMHFIGMTVCMDLTTHECERSEASVCLLKSRVLILTHLAWCAYSVQMSTVQCTGTMNPHKNVHKKEPPFCTATIFAVSGSRSHGQGHGHGIFIGLQRPPATCSYIFTELTHGRATTD